MPRVSVLIPTWNREEYLGEAIESVLNQTYQDFEIVVVDDGSTDGTADLVRRYEGVRYVRQPHRGISAARNRALDEARGELIAWLDSDDLYAPTKLEKQVAYLDAHPECEIIFCPFYNFSDIPYEKMTDRQRNHIDSNQIGYDKYLASGCMYKTLFRRYGGFSLKYENCAEDTEWVARISAANIDISHCLRENLYLRRIHDNQITFTHAPLNKGQYLALYADAIRNAKRKGNKSC